MKFIDTCKLVILEYRYEKTEWIISIILQILIFSCDLFLLSLVFNIDDMGSNYLKYLYKDGYTFTLKGYSEEDKTELENMGFYDLCLDRDGGSGTLDNLNGIWFKKVNATIHGKDIWNKDIDEFLIIIGSFQITLGTICFVMLIILLNNLSNSFTMKLTRRSDFIKMLFQLGCSAKVCKRIYYDFFSIRNFFALSSAVLVNARLVTFFNRYIYNHFFIYYQIQTVNWAVVISLWIMIELFMRAAFKKVWSKHNEFN